MKRRTKAKRKTKHKMVTAEEKEKVDRIGIVIKNHKNDSII